MAQRAGPLKQMGLARRFKKEAETAIQLDPRQIDARFALMLFHLKAPGIVGGDKKKASVMADEIVALDPVEGNIAKARLTLERHDTTGAEAFYRKAVEANPASYQAHVALANYCALEAVHKWDVAEKHAVEARKIDPRRAGSYTLLASVYANQDRLSDLDAVLAEADTHAPDNRTPHYQAGRILLVRGKELDRAERCFRRYLEAEPEGNSPRHAHARWRLAQVLEKRGHKPEAIAELETALRLMPELQEAKKDLKRLKRT